MSGSARPLLALAGGALAGGGLWWAALGRASEPDGMGPGGQRSHRAAPAPTPPRASGRRGLSGPIVVAVLAGLVVGLAVGLPVLALAAGGIAWLAADIARVPSIDTRNTVGDAVASWTETIGREIDAGQPTRNAVLAACDQREGPLVEPLRALAAQIETRPLPEALAEFARRVGHPAVSTTAMTLSLAYLHGAGDLPRLMAEQVEATRHTVATLRDVHAGRARYRRSMTLLLGLFALVAVGLLVVWPAMIHPYRSLPGELVLAAILTVVLGAVRSLLRLARAAPTPDFFHPGPPA